MEKVGDFIQILYPLFTQKSEGFYTNAEINEVLQKVHFLDTKYPQTTERICTILNNICQCICMDEDETISKLHIFVSSFIKNEIISEMYESVKNNLCSIYNEFKDNEADDEISLTCEDRKYFLFIFCRIFLILTIFEETECYPVHAIIAYGLTWGTYVQPISADLNPLGEIVLFFPQNLFFLNFGYEITTLFIPNDDRNEFYDYDISKDFSFVEIMQKFPNIINAHLE